MVIRRFIGAVALVLATTMSAGAAEPVPPSAEPVPRAAEPVPVPCSLGGRNVAHSVKALYNYEDSGYTAFRQFIGAELFVPALPGLTAEWLDRVITSEVASGQCNFGVRKVDVEVLSDGGGFSVRLSSHDRKGAAEILRHAQQMVK